MKKIITPICLTLIFVTATQGQNLHNVYKDAIALSKTIGSSGGVGPILSATDQSWVAILKGYITDKAALDTINTPQKLKAYYLKNPFLKTYLSTNNGNSANVAAIAPVTASQIDNNFSAPALSAALVNVIIERAKQELTVAFFDHFKTVLQDHPALDTLFPKTSAFIINIESYLYAGSLNTLRQAFATDLNNLPAQIPAAIKTPEIYAILAQHPQYTKAYLMLPAVSLVGSILKGQSTGNVVKALYPDTLVKKADLNVYAALQTIVTLSESVRDSSGKTNWISAVDLNANILSDAIKTNLFLGLLYEETKPISFTLSAGSPPISLSSLITPAIATTITGIVTAWNDLDAAINTLKTATNTGTPNRFDQIIAAIDKVILDCQSAIDEVAALVNAPAVFQNKVNQICGFIPQLAAIVQNVHDTQYSAAVFNSVILINVLLQNDQNTTVQAFLKYASFMAAIAEAKTSTDVSNAIDAAILPVGSSSIKANTAFSISINSYIGAGVYWEQYRSSALPNHLTLPTLGVSLPIGVAFSWGLKGKAIGSFSLFASVIDLGAVASFKLSTPDSATSQALPTFTWQNILAPGIYAIFGRLGNSPIALGFGIQKGPQLRSISYTATGGETVDLSQNEAFRYGAFLSVDIPFFSLHSVPYTKPYTQ